MSLMVARLTSITVALVMLGFVLNPLSFAGYYIVFRPVVQPFAYLKYTFWGGIPLTSVIAIVFIIFTFIDSLRKGNRIIPGNVFLLYLFLYFAVLSFYNTPSFMISFAHMVKILTAIAMYMLIYNNIDTLKDLKKILNCYFLCSIVPLVFGFYQYVTKTAHYWEIGPGSTRIDSVIGQPNAYGEFLAILICLLIAALFCRELNFNIWPLLLLGLGVVVSFILSLNRGSWIGLGVGIILASFWYRRHVNPAYIIAGGVVIVLIASPVLLDRFSELNEKYEWGGSKNTFSGRMDYWFTLFDLLLENPVLGYGIGTAGTTRLINYAPHNDYLRLALETGVPGALFYVGFLFKELLDHIQRLKTRVLGVVQFSIISILFYFIILSMFQNIVYNQVVFPMVTGLFALSARLHFLESNGSFEAEQPEQGVSQVTEKTKINSFDSYRGNRG